MNRLPPDIEQLRTRLRDSGTQQQIADGAGLNYWYVNAFMGGKIRNPGWDKVDAFRRYLDQAPAKGADQNGATEAEV